MDENGTRHGARHRLPAARGPAEDRQSEWVGDVTWRLVAGLREALFDEMELPGYLGVRLDVRRVTSIDTPGTALLIGANHRAAAIGRRLVLVDAHGPVTAALAGRHMLSDFLVTQVITLPSGSEANGTRV